MLVVFCPQGRDPVNFPDHPYDRQEICRPADLAEFVQQSREKAARVTKSKQSSRLTLACPKLLHSRHAKCTAAVVTVNIVCTTSAN